MAPPVLRGFVQRQLRNAILRSIAIGTAGGFVWMYGYAEPKRRKYEEFYKNYDAEKWQKKWKRKWKLLNKRFNLKSQNFIRYSKNTGILMAFDCVGE